MCAAERSGAGEGSVSSGVQQEIGQCDTTRSQFTDVLPTHLFGTCLFAANGSDTSGRSRKFGCWYWNVGGKQGRSKRCWLSLWTEKHEFTEDSSREQSQMGVIYTHEPNISRVDARLKRTKISRNRTSEWNDKWVISSRKTGQLSLLCVCVFLLNVQFFKHFTYEYLAQFIFIRTLKNSWSYTTMKYPVTFSDTSE